MTDDYPKAATPDRTLEQQIMSSMVPKNEREHWAAREIDRLRAALDTSERERVELTKDKETLMCGMYSLRADLSDVATLRQVEIESRNREIASLRAELAAAKAEAANHKTNFEMMKESYLAEYGENAKLEAAMRELIAELAAAKADVTAAKIKCEELNDEMAHRWMPANERLRALCLEASGYYQMPADLREKLKAAGRGEGGR